MTSDSTSYAAVPMPSSNEASSNGASGGSNAGASLRGGLRTKSYAEGAAALAPREVQLKRSTSAGVVQRSASDEATGTKEVTTGVDSETGDKVRHTTGYERIERPGESTKSYGEIAEVERTDGLAESLRNALEAEKKELDAAMANLVEVPETEREKVEKWQAQYDSVAQRSQIVAGALGDLSALPKDAAASEVRAIAVRAQVTQAPEFRVEGAEHMQVFSGSDNRGQTERTTRMQGKNGAITTDVAETTEDSHLGLSFGKDPDAELGDNVSIDTTLGRSQLDKRTRGAADGSSDASSAAASTEVDLARGTIASNVRHEHERTEADGSKVSSALGERAEVDVLGGTLEIGSEQARTTTDAAGNANKEITSDKRGLAIGAGAITASSSNVRATSETDADGNVLDAASATDEKHGGVVLKDGAQGVAGGGSKAIEKQKGALKASATTSADGSFTFGVVPVEGSDPPLYRVTLTLHLEVAASLGVSGDKKAKPGTEELAQKLSASGGVSGSLKGSADLVFTRSIGLDEATKQQQDAEAVAQGGAASGAVPELSRLRQLLEAARASGGGAVGAAALAGNASVASAMGEGDAMSLSLGVAASGSANVDAGFAGVGVGAKGSASKSWTRGLSLKRGKDAKGRATIALTVSYNDASSSELGGSATFEGVTLGKSASSSAGKGQSVTYLLYPDAPDYAALYAEVTGQAGPDEARALANSAAMKAHVTSQTLSQTSTDGSESEAGLLGVSLTGSDTRTQSETLTKSETGLSADIKGGRDSSLTLGVGGVPLAKSGREAEAAGTVAEGGATTLDLTATDVSTNPFAAAGEALAGLASMAGLSFGELAEGSVAETPSERLKGLLTKEYKHLRGITLGNDELRKVQSRARFEDDWTRCAIEFGRSFKGGWEGLRETFCDPQPEPEEADIDLETAEMLCLVRAVATFVADFGNDGLKVLERMLYRWGEQSYAWSTSARLGDESEWPPDLSDARDKWIEAREDIRGLPDKFAGWADNPRDSWKPAARAAELRSELGDVEKAIIASDAFESESARSQMLAMLARARGEIAKAEAEQELVVAEREAAEAARLGQSDASEGAPQEQVGAHKGKAAAAPAAPDLGESEQSEAYASNEELGESLDTSIVAAEVEAASLESVMLANKDRERVMFAAIRSNLGRDQGGTNPAIYGQLSLDAEAAHEDLVSLRKLVLSWIAEIKALRGLYRKACVPVGRWKVSDVGQPPMPDTEPDLEALAEQYFAYDFGSSEGMKWASQIRSLAGY